MIKKGQIVRWNDSKGYGFIRCEVQGSEQATQDVFMHMSALEPMGRRPQVGDVVDFQIEVQADGKQRAFAACIGESESGSDGNKRRKAAIKPVKPQKPIKGVLYRIAIMLVVLAIASFVYNKTIAPMTANTALPVISNAVAADYSPISQAFKQQQSGIQVKSSGVVTRILADDNKGSRHQRFIIKLNNGQTLLIAHNIDLAPKINSLKEGDTVSFYGQYEHNDRGGVVHWTHYDPNGRHLGGWLKHQGKTYQ
ncbi:Conserved hypothetical protein [Shewanella piezotolerans WP3]|uniref:Cold-shock domain-containing protein n=1 Tax=Shewanella piezotolerans (strain WP3 / JCM 13877) TaxID=225849 RepID=B8CSS3_SHEPW|nr:Conserved hypothetical protein [Shewanella piezotolerans WP3]